MYTQLKTGSAVKEGGKEGYGRRVSAPSHITVNIQSSLIWRLAVSLFLLPQAPTPSPSQVIILMLLLLSLFVTLPSPPTWSISLGVLLLALIILKFFLYQPTSDHLNFPSPMSTKKRNTPPDPSGQISIMPSCRVTLTWLLEGLQVVSPFS